MSEDKHTYTTGEIVGKTNLTAQMAQGFVKSFPFAFGEAARKNQRGRRWTGQDVKNLLLIRYLKSKRESRERIAQALRGEWTPEALPWIEIEEALQIANSVTSLAAQAQKAAKDARASFQYWNTRLVNDEKRMDELESELKILRQWHRHMLELDPDFNPRLNRAPVTAAAGEAPKKKGWF